MRLSSADQENQTYNYLKMITSNIHIVQRNVLRYTTKYARRYTLVKSEQKAVKNCWISEQKRLYGPPSQQK